MTEDSSTQALFDLWTRQIEEGTQAWAQLMGQAVDPALFWRPFMDQGIAAWSKLLSQGPVTPDLLTQWKHFLDQWIAAWGKVLEQAMGTEAFAQALGRHLEQWLSVQAPLRKAADQATEATLSALGIPSRSQVVGVARQLVDLEDRIERLEDQLGALMSRMDDLFKALADHEEAAARRAGGEPGRSSRGASAMPQAGPSRGEAQ
ncbi:MAG: hypothetical protein HY724_07705 [Candidatus Rokubacteria bacterium]|nr:hypothetical protein [Candidatus Rokubacteria bacterium]